MKIKIIYFLLAGLIMIFSGCSKTEETEVTPEIKTPSIAKDSVLVNVPEGLKNSTNPMAQYVVQFFNGLNSISKYAGLMHPPQGAATFNSGVPGAVAYTWNDGAYTYWFVYHEEGGKCIWKVDADFGQGKTHYIEGEETCNGDNGKMDVWLPEGGSSHAEWQHDANGNLTFTVQTTQNNENFILTGVVNADGSGHATVKTNGQLVMELTWNADGSGTYTVYVTNPPFQGSWTNG